MLEEPPMTMGEINPDTPYSHVSEIVYAYCAERDQTICILCGQAGSELHHVLYRSQGGKHNTNNLATLCKRCHDGVHNGIFGKNVAKALLRKIKINDREFRRRLK